MSEEKSFGRGYGKGDNRMGWSAGQGDGGSGSETKIGLVQGMETPSPLKSVSNQVYLPHTLTCPVYRAHQLVVQEHGPGKNEFAQPAPLLRFDRSGC